jgi:hypothetical protein
MPDAAGLELSPADGSLYFSSTMTMTARNELSDTIIQHLMLELIVEEDTELDGYLDDTASESSNSDVEMLLGSDELGEMLKDLHSRRYLQPRVNINKPMSLLLVTLVEYRHTRPEFFRRYLRVWPETFDALLEKICKDEVFLNNSNNQQLPVEQQVAVTLYRFGHFGNAVSMQEVALWAGWGFGTVDRSTRHVVKALCRTQFRRVAIKWPDEVEKEKAKDWVQEVSCPEWRGGWLMVDGTLVPLFQRPGFYGNTWYDRKSNYSMNVQVSHLPCTI